MNMLRTSRVTTLSPFKKTKHESGLFGWGGEKGADFTEDQTPQLQTATAARTKASVAHEAKAKARQCTRQLSGKRKKQRERKPSKILQLNARFVRCRAQAVVGAFNVNMIQQAGSSTLQSRLKYGGSSFPPNKQRCVSPCLLIRRPAFHC